jgi:hypothetical protein
VVRVFQKTAGEWRRTSLDKHIRAVSVDFFTVPTIRFQVLLVFLVLANERRRMCITQSP